MQKQTPLISVIMPLYNAERFVGESIENVLRQTVGDFELIVIDDASTDASAEIARAYAAKDDRIVLMHNELNSGAARTRNRALDAARGKFITFMDAVCCTPCWVIAVGPIFWVSQEDRNAVAAEMTGMMTSQLAKLGIGKIPRKLYTFSGTAERSSPNMCTFRLKKSVPSSTLANLS